MQGPARRVAAADATGESEVAVAITVFDTGDVVEGDGRGDVVFEKVGSCEEEVGDIVTIDVVFVKAGSCEVDNRDIMRIDVVFVKVGSCAVEVNDGGGIDVVLAKITDIEETVGGTTLEVGGVSVVMAAEEKRVVLEEDIEEGVDVSNVVVAIFTTCWRREEDGCARLIIVATVTKSVSTAVDVESIVNVDAEVLGNKSEYVDVVALAYGSGVGIDGIVVLEAVLFGALPMPVNPIPGLGG
jgi:hypothetical protein